MTNVHGGAAFERLRRRYRPERIRVLLVGESPPAGGTFFYDDEHRSKLRRVTESAMGDALGDRIGTDFLAGFARLGFYLDDLCLEPVNDLQEDDRLEARHRGERALAERIRSINPLAVVGIGIGCRPNFVRAHRASGASAPLEVLPFPNWPRDVARYADGVSALVGRLERAGELT